MSEENELLQQYGKLAQQVDSIGRQLSSLLANDTIHDVTQRLLAGMALQELGGAYATLNTLQTTTRNN